MSLQSDQTRKKLESQLAKQVSEIEASKIEVGNLQKQLAQKEKAAKELREKIAALAAKKRKEIGITEHALLRYLERVKGMDLAALEQEIITEKIRGLVAELGGSGQYPSGEGYAVVMKDFQIVTII